MQVVPSSQEVLFTGLASLLQEDDPHVRVAAAEAIGCLHAYY